jgi:hypothetical protein
MFARDGEHRGNEAGVRPRESVLAHHQALQLVEPGIGRLVPAELQGAREVVDDRMVGAVDAVRRALQAHAFDPVPFKPVAQFLQDAALADARFAG